MKYIYLIGVLWMFSGCVEDDFEPVAKCQTGPFNHNPSHPKHAAFTQWMDAYYARGGYPGLVLAVMDSTGRFWIDTRGYAVIEQSDPLQPCQRHHSASVSKTYIATVVMRLYEQGRIDLDEKLANYLPFHLNIANFECVTVRQLLGHRSGIFDYDTNPRIFIDYLNDPFQVTNWYEVLERYVVGQKAYFTCGERSEYSDTNYLLLGVLLEQVTGKPLGQVMQEQLIGPLRLRETYYKASPGYPEIPFTANNYFYFSEGKLQNCTDWQEHFANISMGHEGIIASPANYVVFLRRLVDGNIVKPQAWAEMNTFYATPDSDTELGLGLERITTPAGTVFGHSGGGFGSMTLLFHEPESGAIFFVATNVGAIFESDAGATFYDALLTDLIQIIRA